MRSCYFVYKAVKSLHTKSVNIFVQTPYVYICSRIASGRRFLLILKWFVCTSLKKYLLTVFLMIKIPSEYEKLDWYTFSHSECISICLGKFSFHLSYLYLNFSVSYLDWTEVDKKIMGMYLLKIESNSR